MMLRTLPLLLLLLATPVAAQVLRIGMAAETDGADPHHYAMAPNSTFRDHIWEALIRPDEKGVVGPGLAVSWEQPDDLTWRFRLRRSARFSDGAAFGALDVVATFCRLLNNREEQVSSFSRVARRLTAVEADGEDTLVIRTREPEPLMLINLATIAILPRGRLPAEARFDAQTACGGGEGWPTASMFADGEGIPGTGPFRLVRYQRGGTIVLGRNPHFDGAAPNWTEVRLTPLTQVTARLAALLAGDLDVVEAPGTPDIPRLRSDPRFVVTASPTFRLVFMQLDVSRDPSPFVVGRNALMDVRVRQALSLAINRTALMERIMDGLSLPAAQFLPTGLAGTLPDLGTLPYDPARARALLAEAGYPQGFAMTLHATNNRYVNDAALAQAVAQQWQRVGVKVTVDTLPAVSFFPRRGKREFSVAMGGWATEAAETLAFFRVWLASTNEAAGIGTSNYGGWADPAFDALVQSAVATMAPEARAEILRRASALALAQMPVIPVHFEKAVWAMRAGLHYPGRADQTTIAQQISGGP